METLPLPITLPPLLPLPPRPPRFDTLLPPLPLFEGSGALTTTGGALGLGAVTTPRPVPRPLLVRPRLPRGRPRPRASPQPGAPEDLSDPVLELTAVVLAAVFAAFCWRLYSILSASLSFK